LNWTKLKNNIPNKIRTKARIYFDVLWQDNPTDKSGKRLFGLTTFEPNQIILATNQSEKEAVHTFVHEAIHAFDDSYEIGLTETQVRKLEKAFPYMFKFFMQLEGKE
jgi:hypothetical protein